MAGGDVFVPTAVSGEQGMSATCDAVLRRWAHAGDYATVSRCNFPGERGCEFGELYSAGFFPLLLASSVSRHMPEIE